MPINASVHQFMNTSRQQLHNLKRQQRLTNRQFI